MDVAVVLRRIGVFLHSEGQAKLHSRRMGQHHDDGTRHIVKRTSRFDRQIPLSQND